MKNIKYFLQKSSVWSITGLIVIAFMISGCQSTEPIGDCPVKLQSVTQDSRDSFVTFEFEIPEGWMAYQDSGYFTVIAFPKDKIEEIDPDEDYDMILGISNYNQIIGDFSFHERIAATNELFKGNNQPFEEFTKKNAGMMDKDITADDFEFELYKGRYGKIAAVKYTITYPEKYDIAPYHIIRCYREDIPYVITGTFHDSNEISSGDIALWAADSLSVTEHFTIVDGVITKN